MELQEKETQKDYGIQEICSGRTYNYKMSINSRLKVIKIIGQRKAFYRQIIPESSCARKRTVDIEIPHPLKSSTVEWLTKRTKKKKKTRCCPFPMKIAVVSYRH